MKGASEKANLRKTAEKATTKKEANKMDNVRKKKEE